jgi:hypothetical protein
LGIIKGKGISKEVVVAYFKVTCIHRSRGSTRGQDTVSPVRTQGRIGPLSRGLVVASHRGEPFDTRSGRVAFVVDKVAPETGRLPLPIVYPTNCLPATFYRYLFPDQTSDPSPHRREEFQRFICLWLYSPLSGLGRFSVS